VRSRNERLIDVRAVSELTGIKIRTLKKWRTEGRGPAAMRIEGRLVRYSLRVVQDWIRDQPGVGASEKSEVAG
jgi:predicted DNA-binding transcriptional regulator AlpA